MALITELPANLAAAALLATTGSLLRRHRRGVAVDDAADSRLRHSGQRRQLPQRRLARHYAANQQHPVLQRQASGRPLRTEPAGERG
ncbi:hypothetical protein [Kitasatospora herbaricolor]|uniref:hypothetical protein n=1 Tax=Kitasatospora herbaricolor TaxID=68217 RepID=UPI0039A58BBD